MSLDDLPDPADYPYLLRSHAERIREIEKYQPAVMWERLETVIREVRGLKAALLTVAGSVLLLAISIAFAFH